MLKDRYLTPNFTLHEFTYSQAGASRKIDNTPDDKQMAAIETTAKAMEQVRKICGNMPIHITSGFRSPRVNGLIGGSKTSAHLSGHAADFRVARLSVAQVIDRINASGLKYDQLINEYDSWVHISFDPRLRQQSFKIG